MKLLIHAGLIHVSESGPSIPCSHLWQIWSSPDPPHLIRWQNSQFDTWSGISQVRLDWGQGIYFALLLIYRFTVAYISRLLTFGVESYHSTSFLSSIIFLDSRNCQKHFEYHIHIWHMPLQLRFCAIFEIWVCCERYEKTMGKWFQLKSLRPSDARIYASVNKPPLVPTRWQAIIWTSDGIFLIGNLGTNFSKIFSDIQPYFFKKMNLKMLPEKWQPFCLGINE